MTTLSPHSAPAVGETINRRTLQAVTNIDDMPTIEQIRETLPDGWRANNNSAIKDAFIFYPPGAWVWSKYGWHIVPTGGKWALLSRPFNVRISAESWELAVNAMVFFHGQEVGEC